MERNDYGGNGAVESIEKRDYSQNVPKSKRPLVRGNRTTWDEFCIPFRLVSCRCCFIENKQKIPTKIKTEIQKWIGLNGVILPCRAGKLMLPIRQAWRYTMEMIK